MIIGCILQVHDLSAHADPSGSLALQERIHRRFSGK